MTINGDTYPDPSSCNVSIEHIDQAERNSAGTMLIDAITVKRKYEFRWNRLSNSDAQSLLTVVSSLTRFVELQFTDPVTGAIRTGTFYTGSKSAEVQRLSSGVAIGWVNIGFSAIEQ